MKLPFKLPAIKLPKFGKKKAEEDEDDDDFDFDPSDFEGDANAALGDAPESTSGEGMEDVEAPDSPADEGDYAGDEDMPSSPASEGMDEGLPAADDDMGGEADPLDDLDGGADGAEEDPLADLGLDDDLDDIEDIDFGDDDDDDDDEESGGKSAGLKNLLADPKRKKLVIFGGGGTVGLLLIGGLAWFFMSGDGEAEKGAKEESLVPKVAIDIAPKTKAFKEGSLNAIAAGEKGPGSGVQVAVAAPTLFASIAPPAVIDGPLAEASDPTLFEESPQGPLPKVSEDGRLPWQVYAKPFDVQDARPRVAIVVRGLGLSESVTQAAIGLLPGNVTLAFDPYAFGVEDWVARARQAGHEVVMMLPLEPTDFPTVDPGPQALMTTNAPEENRMRLEFVMSRSTGYVGVMTVMGSKFNKSEEHLGILLEELRNRGLMLLDNDFQKESVAPKIATEIGLPRAMTDIVLDAIPTKPAIDAQLVELEGILTRQPAAVAVIDAYPFSIERVAAWTAELEAKNLVLAPLSNIADKQFIQ